MTAQFPEKLLIGEEMHSMCETPLDVYFALGGIRPLLEPVSTALWRCYVGTWEILDDRLYLVGIDATLRDGRIAALTDLFPGFPERVFAHWYTGTLRIPQGRMLQYVHAGFASRTERDLLIEVEDGVITGERMRINGTAESGTPGATALPP